MTSCIALSSAPEYTSLPRRFAGTARQYSKNAMSQLTSTTTHSGWSLNLRCPYQANVMKMFEQMSSTGGSNLAAIMSTFCRSSLSIVHSR
ncbi:Uncharacterised protein [Mycobacteroides abscessus subsp. abscessus]|nr:Uncharacterised protein [Mycobacteroides abscessus subsp. abscessus]SHV29713.1 Uncharacterised protein [Mycobacteroides abscessus subsp. abscessus]